MGRAREVCLCGSGGGRKVSPRRLARYFHVSSGTKGRAGFGRAPKAFWASSTRPWRHAYNARSYPFASGAARRQTTRPRFTGPLSNPGPALAVTIRLPCGGLARRVLAGLSATVDVDNVGKSRVTAACIFPRVFFAPRARSLRVLWERVKSAERTSGTRQNPDSREKCDVMILNPVSRFKADVGQKIVTDPYRIRNGFQSLFQTPANKTLRS